MSPEEKALYEARSVASVALRQAEATARLMVNGSDGNPKHFRLLAEALGKAIAAEEAYWKAEEAILRFDHPNAYGKQGTP